MTVPLCFVDCETTGVHPGRRAWEVAIIRREPDGTETEWLAQVADVDLSQADPFGLKVGRFYDRHRLYRSEPIQRSQPIQDGAVVLEEVDVAAGVEWLTRGAHLVGAVPNFDAEVFADMLRRHRLAPAWHYHLVDIEALAVGYLHGRHSDVILSDEDYARISPPWKSDDLSRACGVEPPSDGERHTALGDARWALRLFDAITGGKP